MSSDHDMKNHAPETMCVHGGDHPDEATGAVSTPIYQVSTFAFKNAAHAAACFAGEDDGYIYSRLGNPTIDTFEKKLAALEGTDDALAFGSGMAAVHNVSMHLAHGGHIVSSNTVYGGTFALYEHMLPKMGIPVSFVDMTKIEEIDKAIRPETKMIFIETPANPTLMIADIAAIADLAHSKNLKLVVDNTFCTPYLQQPIALGADIVLHSGTKYIGGHGDAVSGVYAGAQDLIDESREWRTDIGGVIAPLQSWLLLRGLKTLHLRVQRSQENAIKMADFLNEHPKVEWVMFPGLESHPQYELGKKQMRGPGGVISFEVKGGVVAGSKLMDSVKLMTLAVSLGDVSTLIEHPASMTHSTMTPEDRAKYGLSDGLVRIATGVENSVDQIADIEQALAKI